MKLYLRTDEAILEKEFLEHKDRLIPKYSIKDLNHQKSEITFETDFQIKDLRNIDFDYFFNYEIFPLEILYPVCEWRMNNRQMKEGDVILQQILLPPISHLSLKAICAVKIKEMIFQKTQIGFSYETIEGHVETGISTFLITVMNDHSLNFSIETFSEPGNFLTQLLSFISNEYQKYCTTKALEHISKRKVHLIKCQ